MYGLFTTCQFYRYGIVTEVTFVMDKNDPSRPHKGNLIVLNTQVQSCHHTNWYLFDIIVTQVVATLFFIKINLFEMKHDE